MFTRTALYCKEELSLPVVFVLTGLSPLLLCMFLGYSYLQLDFAL